MEQIVKTAPRWETDASSEALIFRIDDEFLQPFKTMEPAFGFNGLGKLTYQRTYSRVKKDGTKEVWWETVARVVEGIYSLQKEHIDKHHLGWNEERAQRSAGAMFTKIFHMKFTPPGRGFWVMGTDIIHVKRMGMAANNCAFVSTEFIDTEDPTFPFTFLMDASMQGTGVGFDLKGAGKINIYQPNQEKSKVFVIPDSREGWVDSLKVLLESYFSPNKYTVEFDYSKIRPKGTPIKTFGGKSSGYKPLKELHERVRGYLNKDVGGTISMRSIIDIENAIGVAVVAGNVRRSAEIVFGPDNDEYIYLKSWEKHPERQDVAHASNNSIFAVVGQNYARAAKATHETGGEPGYEWLDNARAYGRMCEPPNWKDHRASGGNPCLEQTLEHGEVCCLVETYPFKHDSLEEYQETLKYAYLYAKTVTLIPTNWPQTNQVVFRNRRIGTSMSGLAQFIEVRGLHELKKWCEEGYQTLTRWDKTYSEWFGIHPSIKLTSIKPSGSVSLLAGATAGMHYPMSRYYIKRMRLAADSDLIPELKASGYHIEQQVFRDPTDPTKTVEDPTTVVVTFPVDCGVSRGRADVSIWEQVALSAFLHKYWADNQVSCTVTYNPETEADQIEKVLTYFQYELKGISFLPLADDIYPQMPEEKITEAEYVALAEKIGDFNASVYQKDAAVEKFCDGDTCTM